MLYIHTQKRDMILEFHGAYAREEEYIEKNKKDEEIKKTGYFVGLVGMGAIAKYKTLERAMEVKQEILNIINENKYTKMGECAIQPLDNTYEMPLE